MSPAEYVAISKPGTIRLATQNKIAFNINPNNPKVMIFSGSVRSLRIGLINVLIKPITTAAIRATVVVTTLIPGTIKGKTRIATDSKIHLRSALMIMGLVSS